MNIKKLPAQNKKWINAASFFGWSCQHFHETKLVSCHASMQLIGPFNNLTKSDCAALFFFQGLVPYD
jgi:hypothetical protein